MKFDCVLQYYSIGGEGDDYMGRAFLTASVRTGITLIASCICTEYCE